MTSRITPEREAEIRELAADAERAPGCAGAWPRATRDALALVDQGRGERELIHRDLDRVALALGVVSRHEGLVDREDVGLMVEAAEATRRQRDLARAHAAALDAAARAFVADMPQCEAEGCGRVAIHSELVWDDDNDEECDFWCDEHTPRAIVGPDATASSPNLRALVALLEPKETP